MSDSEDGPDRCTFETTPPTTADSEADTWRCPHPTHEDRSRCVFHLPREGDRAPDDADVDRAVADALAGETRPALVGATLGDVTVDPRTVDGADPEPIDLRGATVDGDLRIAGCDLERPVRLSGAEVTGSVVAERSTFRSRVSMTDCTVGGDLELSGASIEGGLSADGATVEGRVVLEGTAATSDVSFPEATLRGGVDGDFADFEEFPLFDGASFGGAVSFRAADFERGVRFEGATFGDDVDFTNADFGEVGWFNEASFEGDRAVLSGTNFAEDVRFEAVTATATVTFSRAQVGTDLHLTGSRFAAPLRLNAASLGGALVASVDSTTDKTVRAEETATFEDDLQLRGARVGGAALFADVTFAARVCLASADVDGSADFEEARFDRQPNFEATRFGGPATFAAATVAADAAFDRATFDGAASFAATTFRGAATFEDAVFARRVDFEDATFEAVAGFETVVFEHGATFDGAEVADASFRLADFESLASFADAAFEHHVDFVETHFVRNARFDGVAFHGGATFEQAQFEADVVLADGRCDGTLSLVESRVGGDLDGAGVRVGGVDGEKLVVEGETAFDDADADGRMAFERATFRGTAGFESVTVGGATTFRQADFLSVSRFAEATLEGTVSFEGAAFRRRAVFRGLEAGDAGERCSFESVVLEQENDFREATFGAPVRFDEATLSSTARFRAATFRARSRFRAATFHGGANFEATTFEGEARFDRAAFRDATSFDGAETGARLVGEDSEHRSTSLESVALGGDVRLRGADFDALTLSVETTDPGVGVDLREATVRGGRLRLDGEPAVVVDLADATVGDVTLSPTGEATLRRVRLLRTRFEGFSFSDHRQALADGGWRLHTTVDDESALDVDSLIDTYMYAKQGATAVADEQTASKFFQREMQYRQTAHGRRFLDGDAGLLRRLDAGRRYVSNLVLRVTCGYGEKTLRPVTFSLFVIGVFSLLYAVLDVDRLVVGPSTLPIDGALGYLSISFQSFLAVLLGVPEGTTLLLSTLIAVEAFVGGFAVALFVFTFTRSMKR